MPSVSLCNPPRTSFHRRSGAAIVPRRSSSSGRTPSPIPPPARRSFTGWSSEQRNHSMKTYPRIFPRLILPVAGTLRFPRPRHGAPLSRCSDPLRRDKGKRSLCRRRASSSRGFPCREFSQSPGAAMRPGLVAPTAAAASYREFDDFATRRSLEFLRCRFEVKIDGFADVGQRFLAGFSLGPAALERWAVRHDIAVFALFNDNLQVHSPNEYARTGRPEKAKSLA